MAKLQETEESEVIFDAQSDYHRMFSAKEIVDKACEDIHYDNKVYMFTWNPKPNFYQYDKLGNNDFKCQWVKMITVLKHINRCSNSYCLVPEISDEGKLHVHGWFRLDDKLKWLKSVKPMITRNGFMKINRLYVPIERIDYYYKELDETKGILNEMMYILTPFTIKEVLYGIMRYQMELVKGVDKSVAKYKYDLEKLVFINN